MELMTRPLGKHQSGGWQNRYKKWTNHTLTKSVVLDDDDCNFIIRNMINKNGGGNQCHLYNIFIDTHPLFTNIEVKPRKPRKARMSHRC